jgi:hypothetical protein
MHEHFNLKENGKNIQSGCVQFFVFEWAIFNPFIFAGYINGFLNDTSGCHKCQFL